MRRIFLLAAFAGAFVAGAVVTPVSAVPATTTSPAPAYCGQHTTTGAAFAIRVYPASPAAGQDYLRSGAHGHGGLLRCITFYVGDKTGAQYVKTLVIDQGSGGLVIPVGGVDVTYVNCGLAPLRFPPPPFTGVNDCGEAWGTSESGWTFPPGSPTPGLAMIPEATP